MKGEILVTSTNRYTVTKQIGQGGSGRVFEVVDEDGTALAAKCLDPSKASRTRLKRFRNELKFGRMNEHPNVVTILDDGRFTSETGDMPFFIMPRYGGTLKGLITKGIAHDSVLTLFENILDGIEAAHLQGIHHRDIKPENVFVNKADGSLVVGDFGIARFEKEDLYTAAETKDTERLANFKYAAPEQKERGEPVDQRADIFALGLLLNEMFTGRVPQGSGYRLILEIAPCFAYLDPIVDKMTRSDPAARYTTMAETKHAINVSGQAYLEQQRLDELKGQVVKASQVSDPLIDDPVRVVGTDLRKGRPCAILNHEVTAEWAGIFAHVVTFGHFPSREQEFDGDAAVLKHHAAGLQSQVDMLKRQLVEANRGYAGHIREKARQEEARKRMELEAEKQRKAEEVRLAKMVRDLKI